MEEFEVVTGFFTIVPWVTSIFLILGLVAAIALSITLGWWVGNQTRRGKKVKLWLFFGWLPIFGIFVLSVVAASLVYYQSRDNLSTQIKENSGIEVITFVRGDEHRFIGEKDGEVLRCRIAEQPINISYPVNCR